MNILVVLIPISILLLIGAGFAFFWAVEHDQFEDLDTPRLLPLLDDPPPPGEPPTQAEPLARAASLAQGEPPARPAPPAQAGLGR